MALAAIVTALVTTTGAAHAEEPASTAPPAADHPAGEVGEVGEVDGTLVAVGQPPVPLPIDGAVDVAVGQPPVPQDPVPDATVVAVGQPPVAPITIPDALPLVAGLW